MSTAQEKKKEYLLFDKSYGKLPFCLVSSVILFMLWLSLRDLQNLGSVKNNKLMCITATLTLHRRGAVKLHPVRQHNHDRHEMMTQMIKTGQSRVILGVH